MRNIGGDNMANRPYYTDEMKDEFIELAQMKGIAPAIRELGWPSFPTAQKFFKDRNLAMPEIDSLMMKAAEMKVYYDDSAKKASLQIAIDQNCRDVTGKCRVNSR
jgi:hypothetical protein